MGRTGSESAFRRVWFIPLWLGPTARTRRDVRWPLVVKIETLRIVLPLVVGLLIPLFYLGVYLASACQRLRSLQERSLRSRSNLLAKLDEHLGAVRAGLDASAGPPSACESAAAVRRSLEAVRRLAGEAGDADERPEGESLASALGELERALETWSAGVEEEVRRSFQGILQGGRALISLAREHDEIVSQDRAFRRALSGRLAAALVRTPPRGERLAGRRG